jgi:RNA polymerase sigma-70 factor (ECF subfamily)
MGDEDRSIRSRLTGPMPRGSENRPDPKGAARREAFESLYASHSREVWALAYARWMDSDLAMDVTQEAFLRLWRQWEAGDDIQNPRAWLLRVARNLAEDSAKSAFRRNGTQPPEVLNGVRSSQPLPADLLEQEELFAQLRAVLEELSPSDRDILTLRYALDYDANTIADLLDVNVTAVHMRLSRARQRLAERLSTHEDFSPDPSGRSTKP